MEILFVFNTTLDGLGAYESEACSIRPDQR